MRLRLDHIAIAAESLVAGEAFVRAAPGLPLAGGGAHPLTGTHNRLMGLGDVYLEVIAIDPAAPAPDRTRPAG
ncbi:VOC family protein [Pseudogemmobacter sonorensis]|uniref:VOC family protein n=1 Tax=Pseudogemmobacter sonorensis TaxID=2989681 RepID=UPI0036CEB280